MKATDIENAITVDEAVRLIKLNASQAYAWHTVKNDIGCIFELGGRVHKGEFNLKVYVPTYVDGSVEVLNNGHVKHDYSIDDWHLEKGSIRIDRPKGFDLIRFVKETDIREPIKIDTESRRVVTHVSYFVLTDERFNQSKRNN